MLRGASELAPGGKTYSYVASPTHSRRSAHYHHHSLMPVLWITVILSLLLALVFLALFVKEHRRFHFGSPERASLLPLEDDASPTVPSKPQLPQSPPSIRPATPPPSPRRS